jgi:hypothetical protein
MAHMLLQLPIVTAAAAEDEAKLSPEASPAQRQQRLFTCVRLRGLPYDVSEDEVSALLVRGAEDSPADAAAAAVLLQCNTVILWSPCVP